jgi:pimeloyl-ACP methyl ester carboxylesterase
MTPVFYWVLGLLATASAIWLVARLRNPWPSHLPACDCTDSSRTAVIFVHGFASSPKCWIPFLTLFSEDKVSGNYCFACHRYPTSLFKLSPLRRIPRLSELGASLETTLEEFEKFENVILVGHSQGGLAIQSFLKRKLEAGQAKQLEGIKTVILVATPNFGSPLLGGVRRLIYGLWPNPQESTLRALNAEVGDLCRSVARDILWASEVTKSTCPIPFTAFWGLEDNLVPEASARGCVEEGLPLSGDHSGVIRPSRSLEDTRYKVLKQAILNPAGHRSIFEEDRFTVDLCVSPRNPQEKVEIHGKMNDGGDNCARRKMEILFSLRNRCADPFEVKYHSTLGVVKSLAITEPNEARPEDIAENEGLANVFNYCFRPEPGATYFANIEIYNGFGEGNREWHHHLQKNLRCRDFILTLDLQGYVDQGYTLSKLPPTLRYLKDNVQDHSLCGERERWPVVEPSRAGPSLWVWELANLRSGVVDVCWDFDR